MAFKLIVLNTYNHEYTLLNTFEEVQDHLKQLDQEDIESTIVYSLNEEYKIETTYTLKEVK